jgi:hydrogenase-4 component B
LTPAAVILPLLGGVIAVLLCFALVSPRLPAGAAAAATAGLCIVVLLGAVAALSFGGTASIVLPFGLGLFRCVLALDPLAAWFILAIALPGLAGGDTRWRPGLLAAAMLTVLAGDTGTVLIGLAGFTAFCGANRWGIVGVLLAALSLAALSLGTGSAFTAIRLLPPEGWRGVVVLLFLIAGLLLTAWGGPFRRLASGQGASVVAFTLGPIVTAYVICRVVLELSGPATPPWWGVPLLLSGAAVACGGAVYSLRAASLHAVLAGFAALHAGWILAGAGVVAVARAADLLPLATLAGGGMLLHVLDLALFGSLACIAADAVVRGAGSQMLDRLGGLATGMKLAALGVLVAGWSLAFLPPSAGFASGWMLLQALFAATRLGGLALHLVVAVTTLALIASAALAVAAMVRLGAIAFLGRPRTPRAAATEAARGPERTTLLVLSGVTALVGLFPGLLARLADPAQQWLTRAQMVGQAGWAGLQTQQAAPGYVPLAATLLAAAAFAGLLAWRRRLPGSQVIPLWQDGFAAPPAWMPFGDPATQATPAGLAGLLPRRSFALPWPRFRLRLEAEWPALPPGAGAAMLLVLAVVLLLAVLLFGPP